jgi:hypothetical protein
MCGWLSSGSTRMLNESSIHMYSNKHSYHAALYIREQGKVTELRASIDASQKKEKRMYGDNLAELLEYCDEMLSLGTTAVKNVIWCRSNNRRLLNK